MVKPKHKSTRVGCDRTPEEGRADIHGRQRITGLRAWRPNVTAGIETIPQGQAEVVVEGNEFTVADGFWGGAHSGTHWHSNNAATAPAVPGEWMEVGGFFGDEECRGFAEFNIGQFDADSLICAEVSITILDLFALGLSPEADGIDGLYGQGPSVETLTVEIYEGNNSEDLTDYTATAIATVGSIDVTAQAADDVLTFTVTNALQTLLTSGASALGVRVRQTTGDNDSKAITFGESALTVDVKTAPTTTSSTKLLDALNQTTTRTVNGTVRAIDTSRTGTACQMPPGRSYLFNGTSDNVSVDSSSTLLQSGARSWSVWIYPTRASGQEWVMSKAAVGQYAWGLSRTAETLGFSLWSLAGSTSYAVTVASQLPQNTWTHIAIVFDGSELRAYVNGSEVGSDNTQAAAPSTTSTADVLVGKRGDGGGNHYQGYLFDVRMFDREISDAEITAIAAVSLGSQVIGAADAIVFYKCDEGSTHTTAIDSSGNGNDGTITAAAIATFQDKAANVQYSFQAELGFTDDTGVSGAYLPRDESAPTLDTSGSALGCVGPVPHDPIVLSPCGTFDGIADRVDVADNATLDITDHLSISVRAKHDLAAITISGQLVAKWDGGVGAQRSHSLYLSTTEKLTLQTTSDGGIGNDAVWETDAAIAVDSWHTYGATFDGGVVVLYVDGVAIASTKTLDRGVNNSIYSGSADLTIGCRTDGIQFWDGTIDDVRIYQGATGVLSAAQMLAIHNGDNSTPSGQTAVLNLPFCEDGGTTINDRTTNSNDGTLTGTVGPFWANQQSVFETLITDGYRRAGSINIPAALTGGLAADGNALTHGPGKLAPGQSLDITGGEANSVYAQQVADAGVTMTYAQGDDNDSDVLFARVEAAGATTGADDRILVYLPVLTGDDLTNVQAYVAAEA